MITKASTMWLSLVLAVSVSAQSTLGPAATANMALIPGATFEMGQNAADIPKLQEKFGIGRAAMFEEETPKHKVAIGSFYIDRTEVTNAQFKRFIDQNPEWQKDKIAAALHNGRYLQHWNGNTSRPAKKMFPSCS